MTGSSYPDTWEILRVRLGYHERFEVVDRYGRTIGVPHHTKASAERYIDNARQKKHGRITGMKCIFCDEPIRKGEPVLRDVQDDGRPAHAECVLENLGRPHPIDGETINREEWV